MQQYVKRSKCLRHAGQIFDRTSSLRGRRSKGRGKGTSDAQEERGANEDGGKRTPARTLSTSNPVVQKLDSAIQRINHYSVDTY